MASCYMSKIFKRSEERDDVSSFCNSSKKIIINIYFDYDEFFFYLLSATDINPIAAQCTLQTAKENSVNICTVVTDLVSQLILSLPIVAKGKNSKQ